MSVADPWRDSSGFGFKRFGASIFVFLYITTLLPLNGAEALPDFPIKSVDGYAVRATVGGVTVAAQMVSDKTSQETYLGTHLSDKGSIPIFLVIRNTSNATPVVFRPSEIAYQIGGVDSGAGDPQKRMESTARKVGIASTAVISIGGGIVAMKLFSSSQKALLNLTRKEIRSTTIVPGGMHSGFLYVACPGKCRAVGQVQLSIKLYPTNVSDPMEFTLTAE